MATIPLHRLFLAAPLTATEQQALAAFRRQHRHCERPGFRWLPAENLHLTVFFLDAVAATDTAALSTALHSVCTTTTPVSLTFAAFSAQPARQPRLLWAQYQPASRFTALTRAMGAVCQPFLRAPAAPHKTVIPHITLARIKPPTPVGELAQHSTLPDFTVTRLELWQSVTGPHSTRYSALAAFTLSAP